jgi:hypothetical protein
LPKSSLANSASTPAADGPLAVSPAESPRVCLSHKSLARRSSSASDALLEPAAVVARPLEAGDRAAMAATCVELESEAETRLAAAETLALAAARELCTLPPGMGTEPEGSATTNS